MERRGLGIREVVGAGTNLSFRNFWSAYFNTFHNFHRLDDVDTRGGPPIVRPAFQHQFRSGTDERKRWVLFTNFDGSRDAGG